jgi:hypothetical protein
VVSLLIKLPTILNYIGQWWCPVCSCGQEIDVCSQPDELDADGQWADDVWFATHCPACVLDAAPIQLRPTLTDRYHRLRVERLRLGLGSVAPDSRFGLIDPDETARESLGWHSGSITLHAATWRRSPKNGKIRPNDLYMVQLMIKGTIAESVRGQVNPDAIASRPWFGLETLETPEAPGGSVEWAQVLLGATIRDPKRPGLEWRYSWIHSLPASEGFFSLPPDWQWYDYSPAKIGAFINKAMSLYQIRNQGGRSPKLTVPELHARVQQYRADNDGANPKQEALAELTGVDIDTIRNTYQREGIRNYREFLNSAPVRSKKAHTIRV